MNRSFFIIFLLLILIYPLKMQGQQNLAPNPSFEQYNICPDLATMDNFITDWYSPFGTCDYFNACSNIDYQVPQNITGYQYAYDGDGYIGAFLYLGGGNIFSEYFQAKLISPLEKNKNYCISFHVSLADSAQYAIDCFGVYFSESAVVGNLFSQSVIAPNISNNAGNIISNNLGWTKIEGIYNADGTENYVTFGCFSQYQNIDTLEFNNNPVGGLSIASYYFFDNILITNCDADIEIPNIFTPNNDGLNDYLQFSGDSTIDKKQCSFIIYNRWGSKVFTTTNPFHVFWDGKFNGNLVSDGVYYYVFKSDLNLKKGTIHLTK